jgi:hypothetical protein
LFGFLSTFFGYFIILRISPSCGFCIAGVLFSKKPQLLAVLKIHG